MKNARPPRHRPIHQKSKAEQIRTWRKFQEAFHPRPSASERGYDADWRRLRNAYLAEHRECQRCGEPATMVDHKESIRANPARRLDPRNLEAMCFACHHRKSMTWDNTLGKRRLTPPPG
jgi:5-methylcytosine-specific restriction endonuclease McrA